MVIRKLLFATLFLLVCRVVSAGEVLVLESEKQPPYEEALKGFMSSCDCTISEKKVLSQMSEQELMKENFMKEIRRSRPKLIAAIGIDSLRMVKDIKDIPIVYFMIANPRSLLSSEENITGVSRHVSPERQLTILQEVLPNVKRVGLLYDPEKTGSFIEKAQDSSKKLGIKLVLKEVHSPKDVDSAIKSIVKEGIDILWMVPDTTVSTQETFEFFIDSSDRNRIPILTFSEIFFKGAVILVSSDPVDMGKQAGEIAKKILSGTKVADLPKSDARKAVFSLNLKVAKKIDITFTSEAISKAHHKIE